MPPSEHRNHDDDLRERLHLPRQRHRRPRAHKPLGPRSAAKAILLEGEREGAVVEGVARHALGAGVLVDEAHGVPDGAVRGHKLEQQRQRVHGLVVGAVGARLVVAQDDEPEVDPEDVVQSNTLPVLGENGDLRTGLAELFFHNGFVLLTNHYKKRNCN